MTDIVHDNEAAPGPTGTGRGADYVPIFGDSPEGTDVWQRVPYNPDDYGPVSDFATDFDHADPSYNRNAPEIWKELREGGCPVAHSDRYGGMCIPLTHATVHALAYDTENSPRRAAVGQAHVDLEGLKDDELGRQGFSGKVAELYRRNDPTAWSRIVCWSRASGC